jgi:hypothetical protein
MVFERKPYVICRWSKLETVEGLLLLHEKYNNDDPKGILNINKSMIISPFSLAIASP